MAHQNDTPPSSGQDQQIRERFRKLRERTKGQRLRKLRERLKREINYGYRGEENTGQ